MTDRPRLLDLYSKAGGSARGYQMAGFYVVGVDIEAQPRYAGDEFVQGDAIEILKRLLSGGYIETDQGNRYYLRDFAAIHASPPCQQYTPLRARQGWITYPDLIAPTRKLLEEIGRPYVIENVPNSPLLHYISLCGGMFGLRTYRHRRFETSFAMFQPHHPAHVAKTSTKKRRRDFDAGMHISITGDVGSWLGPACMGIDWMTGDELSQAIPPAYTTFLGRFLLQAVRS